MGLERYAAAFRDNDINDAVLQRLTAEDLRELGIASVGHRRRLLDAIAALALTPAVNASGLPAKTVRSALIGVTTCIGLAAPRYSFLG